MDIRMFGYTKQDVILFCYDWPFLSPTPYGSLTSHVIRDHLLTAGSLIPSFCLSIKGRHDAPSLSLCSDGLKSDFGSLCFYNSFCSFQHLSVDVSLNLTVVFLMLPVAVYEYQISFSPDHRLLHLPESHRRLVSAYS